MRARTRALGLLLVGTLVTALQSAVQHPAQPATVASAPPGGAGTLSGTAGEDVPGVGEPGGPSRPLAGAELEQWIRGRAVFDRDFHKSRGLGSPEMNGDSCRACHQDPAIGGAGGLELNVSRFGFDDDGAGPFQDLPGGQGLSKLHPPFIPGREEHDDAADVFEQRQSPSLFGLGFLDAIPDSEILSREDPDDLDGDGIRGVARRIDVGGVEEIGHFGWKAQIPDIVDFIRDAMGAELGLTTTDDGRGFGLRMDADLVADPELSQGDLDDMAFFLSNLASPQRGGSQAPELPVGEMLFATIGCATCHVPTLASALGPVDLYSDLLLHDVMPDDFRGMAEPGAGVGLYRTPPLWGARKTSPYMHDGRAETLEEAILHHHGEADAVRQDFEALSAQDRAALLLFVGDL
jgi:hypothetical protein